MRSFFNYVLYAEDDAEHSYCHPDDDQPSVKDLPEEFLFLSCIIGTVVARLSLSFLFSFHQGALVDDTSFFVFDFGGRVETIEVHFDWEEIDKEEADDGSDQGHEGGEG